MRTGTLPFILGIVLTSAGFLQGEEASQEDFFSEDNILAVMRKVNAYNLAHPYRETDRNWIRATWFTGVMEAYHATGDSAYLKQAQQWAEKHQWQVGTEQSGFNRLFCSMTWAELYLLDPHPKKIAPTIEGLDADLRFYHILFVRRRRIRRAWLVV